MIADSDITGDRYLLKDKAVNTDNRIGVNNNPIGVWYKQAAAYMSVQLDVCTGYDRPESVLQYIDFFAKQAEYARIIVNGLVAAYRCQKFAPRIPESGRLFTTPVGNMPASIILRRLFIHAFTW
jgi:hypothetical protein